MRCRPFSSHCIPESPRLTYHFPDHPTPHINRPEPIASAWSTTTGAWSLGVHCWSCFPGRSRRILKVELLRYIDGDGLSFIDRTSPKLTADFQIALQPVILDIIWMYRRLETMSWLLVKTRRQVTPAWLRRREPERPLLDLLPGSVVAV